jgi:hypothetical protein
MIVSEAKCRSTIENAAEGIFQKENKAGDLFLRNEGGTNTVCEPGG